MSPVSQEELFQDVGAQVAGIQDSADGLPPVQEIESLCMNCHENGTTRLLLTQIPHFREIVIMSFECPSCGFKNSEIQSAGQIQQQGCICTLNVTSTEDLNRSLVKSDTCNIQIPEIELEMPAQRGQLTTVEGILSGTVADIASGQPLRKHTDPESFDKIEAFLAKVQNLIDGNAFPFTVRLDDPAGNSFIEPQPGESGTKWCVRHYSRTPEQNAALGLSDTHASSLQDTNNIRPDEVHSFPAQCPSCVHPCQTNMHLIDIPHFKEVIVMATNCDACGYRSNEVKTGGAVPEKGRKITLRAKDFPDDLTRDILKSESCAFSIPEIKLDLAPGTLGGRFTTLEGLLTQVHDELFSRAYSRNADSLTVAQKESWEEFLGNLQSVKNGERPFTVILDDAMAASYLQNLYAPDPDPEMSIEDYERSHEQNEDLGLNDMKTEDYREHDIDANSTKATAGR